MHKITKLETYEYKGVMYKTEKLALFQAISDKIGHNPNAINLACANADELSKLLARWAELQQ